MTQLLLLMFDDDVISTIVLAMNKFYIGLFCCTGTHCTLLYNCIVYIHTLCICIYYIYICINQPYLYLLSRSIKLPLLYEYLDVYNIRCTMTVIAYVCVCFPTLLDLFESNREKRKPS